MTSGEGDSYEFSFRREYARSCRLFKIAWVQRAAEMQWTHAVDHTFQRRFGVRSARTALLWYTALTRILPRWMRPRYVLMVAEEHPSSPGWYHLHGLWDVEPSILYDGWWKEVKEWWWERIGKAYVRPLPLDPAARRERVLYIAKHAGKWAVRPNRIGKSWWEWEVV